MTSTNVDLARAYFQAVQTGDMATLGDLLDEAIVWHQPGANRFSGQHKGRDAVFAMLGGMMEASQGSRNGTLWRGCWLSWTAPGSRRAGMPAEIGLYGRADMRAGGRHEITSDVEGQGVGAEQEGRARRRGRR